jgi:hypothetical protein
MKSSGFGLLKRFADGTKFARGRFSLLPVSKSLKKFVVSWGDDYSFHPAARTEYREPLLFTSRAVQVSVLHSQSKLKRPSRESCKRRIAGE